MMYRILIQQPSIQKLTDHLWSDAALVQVGKHPAIIRIARRQGKGLLHLVPLEKRRRFGGGVSGPAVKGQQVLHSL